ncbi:MAG: iron chelate uptake ABC transporter family permease subunit [Candidatus Latescibacteria bacterium]|nr:iron chelate uptake ABC transporter family permease subunit [Candidatus Latescibacterota bacterium]
MAQPLAAQDTLWPSPSRTWISCAGLLAALFVALLASLALGSVAIPVDSIAAILFGDENQQASWRHIVLSIRLPRALTGLLAGAALSVSGLQMQTLFRNPLADPFILGISAGASLGVALVVLSSGIAGLGLLASLGLVGHLGVVTAAVAGAGAALALVLVVGKRVANPMTLLLLGLMFGYLTSALVSILLYFSIPEQIQSYILWTFGGFGGVTWEQLAAMAPAVLLGLGLALVLVKPLNALLLGPEYARSLGVALPRLRWWIILSSALLAGTVTAYCGPIGFLGVAVPHLCRALFHTANHRLLLPTCAALGGTLALVADLAARLPGSQATLPLNAVTALIGAPVVAWILLHRQQVRSF